MSFEKLPPELKKKVFKYLGWTDLCQAALVCKTWSEECDDPNMWENFPLKLTLANCDSFLMTKRFAKTKTVELELPGCNLPGCEVHSETEWPILEKIFEFMKSSLKEAVFFLSRCSCVDPKDWLWIEVFAGEAENSGVNFCLVWTPNQNEHDNVVRLDYHLGESNTVTNLVGLIKRTLTGERQQIGIYSTTWHSELRAIPNLFEVLGNQEPKPFGYYLETDLKIKSLGSLDHLSLCKGIVFHGGNGDPIEAEEIEAMDRILAHVAVEPRPRNPDFISYIPKALFLRTSWAESEMLRQSNLVLDCEQEGGGCCDKGCISISSLAPEDSIEEETESDNE